MGGKALAPQVPDLKRINKQEFNLLSREVALELCGILGVYSHTIKVIPSYSDKNSFGDIDLLIDESRLTNYDNLSVVKGSPPKNWREDIKAKFNSKATHETENSNVFSFEYKNVQVDLIRVPSRNFEFAFNYFSWNDLGNLIGRIAKSMGYKFGHEGLFLYVFDGDQKIGEILVTRDFGEALELLGFPNPRYSYSFRNLLQIFTYVTSNPYFDKESFLMENRNHRDRVRDAKRTTYMEFLEFIDKPEILSKYNFATATSSPWVGQLKKNRPEVLVRYSDIKEELAKSKILKKKFNGDIAREYTGLDGIQLGAFLTDFKSTFKTVTEYEKFIMTSLPETIKKKIEIFKSDWKYKPPKVVSQKKVKKPKDEMGRESEYDKSKPKEKEAVKSTIKAFNRLLNNEVFNAAVSDNRGNSTINRTMTPVLQHGLTYTNPHNSTTTFTYTPGTEPSTSTTAIPFVFGRPF